MGMFFNKERFGVDPMTQGAVDQFAALPAPIMEGRKGGGFGEVLKALAGGVLDGIATHNGAAPGYAGAREARQRAVAAMQERQNALQDYEAKRQIDQRYEGPPEPPAMVRNLEAFQNFTPQQRQAFEQYQALVNPRYMTGADKLPYQTNAAPPDFTDDDWNAGQPMGGGASNGTGGFRR